MHCSHLAPAPRQLAAAVAMLFVATALQAQTPTQTVRLCMTDFPPYVSTDLPDGGSLTALARRAFTVAGWTVEMVHVPWVRAFALAKAGDCLLMALWRNDERDALFRYSLPVARMQLGFFVRADRRTALPADATVAYQRGSYLPAELTSGSYKLHELVDPRPGMEMLSLNRIDAVFSERATFEYQLTRQPGRADAVRWQGALEIKPTFMAISKAHPQADTWLDLLNLEIRRSIRH